MLKGALNDAVAAPCTRAKSPRPRARPVRRHRQVVNAVNAAELTLETVVAVRDKVIAAYQDIMKMPI